MESGEDIAFSEFMAARWGPLFRTAYLITGDRHQAEELLQTALAKTYVKWARITSKQAADSYVRTTMFNTAASGWRKLRRERLTDTLPDVGTDGGLPQSDDRMALWAHIQELPPRMRATLVLRFYEDLTEAQAAAELGCSIGSVKSQTHRALARLREAMGDRFDDETITALSSKGER